MARVPDAVVDALRRSHRLGIFLRVAVEPEPFRLWLGINDVPAGIEGIDPTTSEVYLGGGRLGDIPPLEAVINGVADRVQFVLPGLDPAEMSIVDIRDWDVRGVDVHIGIAVLDDWHQPTTAIIPLIAAHGSKLTKQRPTVSGAQNASVSLSFSVGVGITTWDRSEASLWSPEHQRALYPTDAFCDGTTRLERGAAPSWPRF